MCKVLSSIFSTSKVKLNKTCLSWREGERSSPIWMSDSVGLIRESNGQRAPSFPPASLLEGGPFQVLLRCLQGSSRANLTQHLWHNPCFFWCFFFYFHASIFKTLFLNYLPPVHSTPPSKTKRCPYSLKVVTNKKIEKTSVHKARRKWGPLWTVGSYVKWYGHCQMNCEIPGGKNQSIAWSKSLFLDVPPRRIGNRDTEEMSAHSCSFISLGLLSISKMGKQIKCPSTGEQINKQWSKYTMECCPDLKGGGDSDTCYNLMRILYYFK